MMLPLRALPAIEPSKHWSDAAVRRGAVVTVPLVWVTFILSLLVHIAVMWIWVPQTLLTSANPLDVNEAGGPLTVRLTKPPSASAATPAPAAPSTLTTPVPRPRPPALALRALPRPATPIITAPISPIPDIVTPPPAPAQATAPPAPTNMDLSAYIAARRRARGEESPPAQGAAAEGAPTETDVARRDRIVAENLAAVRTPNLGNDPRRGGGLFEIRRLGANDAEFMFYGWNKEIRRRVPQMVEVTKGGNSDIRIAMVRKMINIIRDHEDGDFAWESRRLGRVITLSARATDNGELEAFLMREFFEPGGAPR